jgi:AraC-like DNA-binding protein
MSTLIRSQSLSGYKPLVSALGGDPLPLLERFHIASGALDDEQGVVSYGSAIRMLEATADALSCPDFGLRLAERQGLHILGPLALVAQNASTVAESFGGIGRYLHYHSPALHIGIDADAARGLRRITHSIDVVGCPQRSQVTELTLGVTRKVLQLLAGDKLRPDHVLFRHLPGLPDRRYREWFGCPVRFGQSIDAVVVDAAMLARPIDQSRPELKRMAESFIEGIIGQRAMDVVGQVTALIERLLDTQACTVKQVAAHVCMHERTLQDRLMQEGLSFSLLVDRVRRQRAEIYLSQKGMPMSQVAGLLGFAEQSSFNKACKRWFGVTPRSFRQSLLTHLPLPSFKAGETTAAT